MSDKIGFFFLLPTTDKKGCLGALLVTDDLGKPEEFRVTYPVKPTLLQQQLYGNSLFPHIGVELCGKPLFVSDVTFLPLADTVSCHVSHMARLGDTLRVTTETEGHPQSDKHKIYSSSGRFQPLSLTFPQNYDDQRKDIVRQTLQSLFSGLDLLEPFERIRVAIGALAEQDQRFR